MSDYISRQAAIDWASKIPVHDLSDGKGLCRVIFAEDFLNALKEFPYEQSEIIRCKDCKHYEIWQLKSDYTDDKRYKPSVCTIGAYSVHRSPDWYCADAERRTDGEIY